MYNMPEVPSSNLVACAETETETSNLSSMASHLDDEHLHLLLFLIFSSMLISCRTFAATQTASDILNKGVNITDGKTLVSAGGSFTLGFFAPGVPTRRYLGIWFSMTNASDAVCWVANRDRPLGDTSGVLMVTDTGNLVLLDGSGQTAWSSNTTGGAASPEVQLLESGNLVVRDTSTGTMVWQSFDHPSNTLLPGMKIGRNLWTGAEWALVSWRAANDPSPGTYRYMIVKNRLMENVMVDSDGNVRYRTGVWNGLWFSGIPEMGTYSDMYAYHMTISTSEITYGYTAKAGAPYSRIVLLDTGEVQRLVWDSNSQEWKNFFQGPRDVCDAYAKCGPFGLCDASAASTSFCSCVQGFSPVSPSDWYMRDTSRGCRRNVPLNCSDSKKSSSIDDGFLTVQGVKLPDTLNASMDTNTSVTLDECRARCLANCSCVAYAAADIQGGGAGSGCIIWTNSITDLRYVDGGQTLYLRLANSELGPEIHKPVHRTGNKKLAVILASVFSAMALLILLTLVFLIWSGSLDWRHIIRWCLALDLATIRRATRNFSITNVLGRGSFGTVYKGNLSRLHCLVHGLPDRTIAVKRLDPTADIPERIISYFTREVQVMNAIRLRQHSNVLQFLAYCSTRREKILVYEYMHRGSLEIYIFGEQTKRVLLNWQRRLQIILGIARGVNHLHEGATERGIVILHRDLKPENVVLDDEWNAKVADFGTAKLLVAGAEGTHTIIGTPGYMAPEYVLDEDQTTLKCDVYSFGVTLLETLAGRRNYTGPKTLISSAWELWEDINRDVVDLLDPVIPADHELVPQLRRCIQIGLLCIQRDPNDRPSMSEVVEMLNDRNANLAPPTSPMVQLPDLQEADDAVPIDYAAVSDANLRWQYPRPRPVPRIDGHGDVRPLL